MERALAERLSLIIDGEIHPDYSGRGMFGKTTVGFSCDSTSELIAEIISNAHEFVNYDDEDYIEPEFSNVTLSMDSMGLGVIIY